MKIKEGDLVYDDDTPDDVRIVLERDAGEYYGRKQIRLMRLKYGMIITREAKNLWKLLWYGIESRKEKRECYGCEKETEHTIYTTKTGKELRCCESCLERVKKQLKKRKTQDEKDAVRV